MKEEFFMNEENKCDKYESFFIFKNEEEFMHHIKNCPDCQKEYDKQMRISQLVKEAGAAYLKRKQQNKVSAARKLACCFVLFAGLTAFTGINIYDNYVVQQDIIDNSCISMLGLPIDDYGFLEI